MDFLWANGVELPKRPALAEDIAVDVLVIGGGMAGVLCAHALQRQGVDCVLLEAARIGSGVTLGTTAVLSAQHDTLYGELIVRCGSEKAAQYLQANLHAVAQFRALAQTIPCDFEDRPSVLYSRSNRCAMEREVRAVQKLGFPAEFIDRTPLPFPIAGGVRYPGMAQFHPLKFLAGISKNLRIYEHTQVRKIESTTAFTADGHKIKAKKIIVATHFPFRNSRGLYFMKLYQMRSFVVALSNAPELGATFVEQEENGIYLRNYRGLLLLGGGDHRSGGKGDGFAAVRQAVTRNFPDATEVYAWAAQDCMSLDGVPYIGPYSPATPDIFVATGFNEWGMTSSMVAATILSDCVLGRENPWTPVFSPKRSMLKPQLFKNLTATLGDFVSPTTKRCSHMGCALKWNPNEHSWDCPCHGSRFNESGKLLDNPALKNIHLKP